MAIFLRVLGALVIAVGLTDVFQTLFHPAGRGAMSDWIARVIWKTFRRLSSRNRGFLTFAGPVAILVTITTWAVLTVLGFALIYLPDINAGYVYTNGIHQATIPLWGAVDSSIEALITLSDGAYAKPVWMRLMRSSEAVIGFGLLTASMSWLLSLYPVLENRRSVAHRATLLHHAELETGKNLFGERSTTVETLIYGMAADLTTLRNQMVQFPISYYFHMDENNTALAGILPYIAELADRAVAVRDAPMLQIAGTALGGAVEDFLQVLAEIFLRMPKHDKREILLRYADEQMFEPVVLGSPYLVADQKQ